MTLYLYILLIVAGLTWWITYELFSSPRAQVKRLWKEIFKISAKITNVRKKEDPESAGYLEGTYKDWIEKRKKILNAVLDCYFDPEDDKEYIRENRPLSEHELEIARKRESQYG